MRNELIIYGASDDLIEVEGLVRDELNPPFGEKCVVTVRVSDALWTQIAAEYDSDGEWRFHPSDSFTPLMVIRARGDGEPDDEHGCPGYSDKVVLDMGSVEGRQIAVSVDEVS